MVEKQKAIAADLEEQVKELFIEELQGRDSRSRKGLKELIPAELAKARCAMANTAVSDNCDDRIEFGRERLTRDVLKELTNAGLCEMEGPEDKEEVWLVPGAIDTAKEAEPPTSTKSNQSDVNASKTTPQRNTQNGGKDGGVPANNKSVTPNGTSDDDKPVAVDVPAKPNNANSIVKPADGMSSGASEPELQAHSVADLFPPMSDAEYEKLKADIKANGLLVDGWKYQGKIVDGRNRNRVCHELGIQMRFQEWDGKGSLVAFVLSLNVRRRHLSDSQLAMVAARAIPEFQDEARQRMVAGKRADPPLHEEGGRKGEAADFAAQMVGISRDMVYKAQTVLEKGILELQEAVDAGQISVSAAALLAGLDKKEQRKIVAAGPDAMEQKVKEIRAAGKKPSKGKQPADSATTQTKDSPPTMRDDTKQPTAPAGQPAKAAAPEKDERRNGTPEQKDEQRPAANGGEPEPREDSPSSAVESDSYEAVLERLQASRQFLKEHEKSFPELVKLLDEDQREDLRRLLDDIYSYANGMIAALDNPKLWRRTEE